MERESKAMREVRIPTIVAINVIRSSRKLAVKAR